MASRLRSTANLWWQFIAGAGLLAAAAAALLSPDAGRDRRDDAGRLMLVGGLLAGIASRQSTAPAR